MHELPDENLRDILVIAKRIDIAQGVPHYNNLQKKKNNRRIQVAHQVFAPAWVYSRKSCTKLDLWLKEVLRYS